MERTTQIGAILDHMRTHGSITSIEAFERYGATRLAGLIFELKKQGHCIITEMQKGKNRYGGSCNYAKYIILEPKAKEPEEVTDLSDAPAHIKSAIIRNAKRLEEREHGINS